MFWVSVRVGNQGVKPVRKCLLSWLRATTRAESLREPSTYTLDLIHRPTFALCKMADQALEPLINLALLKTGAVEAASNYSWGGNSKKRHPVRLPMHLPYDPLGSRSPSGYAGPEWSEP